MAQKAYERWALNDGTDGSEDEDGNGEGQLPNQGQGGAQNVGGQLPNQGDRTRGVGEGDGEGEGDGGGGGEEGIEVMVLGTTTILIFINF